MLTSRGVGASLSGGGQPVSLGQLSEYNGLEELL